MLQENFWRAIKHIETIIRVSNGYEYQEINLIKGIFVSRKEPIFKNDPTLITLSKFLVLVSFLFKIVPVSFWQKRHR